MKLPLIPLDKANHFIYGFMIFFITTIFLIPIAGIVISSFFAIAKEAYDYKSYGKFDLKDIVATILPSLLLTLATLI